MNNRLIILLLIRFLLGNCSSSLGNIPVKNEDSIKITFGSCKDHKRGDAPIFD